MSKKTKTKKVMKTTTKRRVSTEQKSVMCKKCGRMPMKIDAEASSGICWLCVTRMCEPPKPTSTQPTGRPRGWQFMKVYVDKDLNVFHKGEKQPDLKGTLEQTKVSKKSDTKSKPNKKERDRIKTNAAAELYDLKNQLAKEKRKTYRAKIEAKIKKVQKILK